MPANGTSMTANGRATSLFLNVLHGHGRFLYRLDSSMNSHALVEDKHETSIRGRRRF